MQIAKHPVEVIHQCASRLYDFHIKDVTEATPKGKSIEVGRGVIDIVGVLKALLEVKFSGHLALEYEDKGDAPVPGMTESFGYIRGVLAGQLSPEWELLRAKVTPIWAPKPLVKEIEVTMTVQASVIPYMAISMCMSMVIFVGIIMYSYSRFLL